MFVQPPESALKGFLQLVYGATDGLVQVRRDVSNSHWLMTLKSGFHHAALVPLARFTPALIAQVNFNPCDLPAESTQGTLNNALDVNCELLSPFDIAVSVDLNLHELLCHLCLLKTRKLRPGPARTGSRSMRISRDLFSGMAALTQPCTVAIRRFELPHPAAQAISGEVIESEPGFER